MTNSFVTSLPALDMSSVTDAASLFFFVSNNDTAYKASGFVLQHQIGRNKGTLVRANSAIQVADGSIPYPFTVRTVSWDTAEVDELNMFDSATPDLLFVRFSGWVQVQLYTSMTEISTLAQRYHFGAAVRKNGAIVRGGEWNGASYIQHNGLTYSTSYCNNNLHTAPFTVTSGDVLSAEYAGLNQGFTGSIAISTGTFFHVTPLAWLSQ